MRKKCLQILFRLNFLNKTTYFSGVVQVWKIYFGLKYQKKKKKIVHCSRNSWFSYFAMWSLFNIVSKSINFIWKTMLQRKCKFFICIERNCNSAFCSFFQKEFGWYWLYFIYKGCKKTTTFFRSNTFVSTHAYHNWSMFISGVIVIGKK